MGRAVGIDLGTTNTVVAVMKGSHPEVLPNRGGQFEFRSVVSYYQPNVSSVSSQAGREELLVGDLAADNWSLAPRDTIVSVKRLMGRAYTDPEVQCAQRGALYEIRPPYRGTRDGLCVVLNGKEYQPAEISAMFLRKAKRDAEFRLKGEKVTHAVITVPAYFTEKQRAATYAAARYAELRVISILDEPSAAALAFGLDEDDNEPKTVLVYDLGGGTFDVSIGVITAGQFVPLMKVGDMWLGGDNFNEALTDHVVERIKHELDLDPSRNLRFMATLKESARKARESLSETAAARILIVGGLQDSSGHSLDVDMVIERAEFERLILPLVGRYRTCGCGKVNHPDATLCAYCRNSLKNTPVEDGRALRIVKQALEQCVPPFSTSDIQCVLMAGNASKMPLVQRSMEELFGADKVRNDIHPKYCVALGAAILAARKRTIVCGHCESTNDMMAETCSHCNRPFIEDNAPIQIEPDNVPNITAHNYGVVTAEGRFETLITAGAKFPTLPEDRSRQTFRTQLPNQPMICIPVYVREDLNDPVTERKQGDAFALLPPELPPNTAVQITLWLEPGELFNLEAHLDNGVSLRSWILRGYGDSRVQELLLQVVERMITLRDILPPDLTNRLSQMQERAIMLLKERNDEEAGFVAEDMLAEINRIIPDETALRQRADELCRFTIYMMHEYEWKLSAAYTYILEEQESELREALRREDPAAVERALASLDAEIDKAPSSVKAMLSVENMIRRRVVPADAAAGKALQEAVQELKRAFKRQDPKASNDLGELLDRLASVLDSLPGKETIRCPQCGQGLRRGSPRYCVDGHDTWLPL